MLAKDCLYRQIKANTTTDLLQVTVHILNRFFQHEGVNAVPKPSKMP